MNRLFKHGFMIIAALILLQGCVFLPDHHHGYYKHDHWCKHCHKHKHNHKR